MGSPLDQEKRRCIGGVEADNEDFQPFDAYKRTNNAGRDGDA